MMTWHTIIQFFLCLLANHCCQKFKFIVPFKTIGLVCMFKNVEK